MMMMCYGYGNGYDAVCALHSLWFPVPSATLTLEPLSSRSLARPSLRGGRGPWKHLDKGLPKAWRTPRAMQESVATDEDRYGWVV